MIRVNPQLELALKEFKQAVFIAAETLARQGKSKDEIELAISLLPERNAFEGLAEDPTVIKTFLGHTADPLTRAGMEAGRKGRAKHEAEVASLLKGRQQLASDREQVNAQSDAVTSQRQRLDEKEKVLTRRLADVERKSTWLTLRKVGFVGVSTAVLGALLAALIAENRALGTDRQELEAFKQELNDLETRIDERLAAATKLESRVKNRARGLGARETSFNAQKAQLTQAWDLFEQRRQSLQSTAQKQAQRDSELESRDVAVTAREREAGRRVEDLQRELAGARAAIPPMLEVTVSNPFGRSCLPQVTMGSQQVSFKTESAGFTHLRPGLYQYTIEASCRRGFRHWSGSGYVTISENCRQFRIGGRFPELWLTATTNRTPSMTKGVSDDISRSLSRRSYRRSLRSPSNWSTDIRK